MGGDALQQVRVECSNVRIVKPQNFFHDLERFLKSRRLAVRSLALS
jgi:hypothetical protein